MIYMVYLWEAETFINHFIRSHVVEIIMCDRWNMVDEATRWLFIVFDQSDNQSIQQMFKRDSHSCCHISNVMPSSFEQSYKPSGNSIECTERISINLNHWLIILGWYPEARIKQLINIHQKNHINDMYIQRWSASNINQSIDRAVEQSVSQSASWCVS